MTIIYRILQKLKTYIRIFAKKYKLLFEI